MTAPLVSFSQRWTLFQHLQFIIEKKSEALEILSSEGAMIAGVELGDLHSYRARWPWLLRNKRASSTDS